MGRPSKRQSSSYEALSDGSDPSDEELVNDGGQGQAADEEVDEEELEAVARSASSADDEDEPTAAAAAAAAAGDGGDDGGDDEVRVYRAATRFCCISDVMDVDLGVLARVLHGWVCKGSYYPLGERMSPDWSSGGVYL